MNNLRKPFSSPESSLRLWCSIRPPLTTNNRSYSKDPGRQQQWLRGNANCPGLPDPTPSEVKGQNMRERKSKMK